MNRQEEEISTPNSGAPVSSPPPLSKERLVRAYLIFSNGSLMIAWARVLHVIFGNYHILFPSQEEGQREEQLAVIESSCISLLAPVLFLALAISFLEVFHAAVGLTRSKAPQVFLFAAVRAGVETLVTPLLKGTCCASSHLFTVTCWSLGDTIRFGCFLLDLLMPGGRVAKTVRYTIGPLLFPLGAFGEMWMVATAAMEGPRPYLWIAVALWPLGFYPLMKQLLKQRRKYFSKDADAVHTTAKVKKV